MAIFGGDLGYKFARRDQRDLAHSGYVIEDVLTGDILMFARFCGIGVDADAGSIRHVADAASVGTLPDAV